MGAALGFGVGSLLGQTMGPEPGQRAGKEKPTFKAKASNAAKDAKEAGEATFEGRRVLVRRRALSFF